ncbi:MAG: ABC transporter permease [Bacteriovorax sp.]|nr:ABC transporter permease [Bacteriovorax sp.]
MQPTKNFKLFFMLFLDATTKKFLIGVWIGLAFSIAVILSTVGIMDGFERALRHGLKKSSGDVTMQSRYGFFQVNDRLKQKLQETKVTNYAALVQLESFLVFNDESRGVVVKGIEPGYGKIVGLPLNLAPDSVAIGSEISSINHIKVGDEIVLAFGKGSAEFKNMPAISRFKVQAIVNHGVYQKDARMVYARIDEIQKILTLSDRVNMISFNIDHTHINADNDLQAIENKLVDMRLKFEPDFYFKPYWREFSSLIEAAQAEKVLISLILQLIVVISVFNVLAFIYFINEKKSKELFLFKALGLSKKAMNNLWIQLVILIWLASSALAMVFVQIFRFLLLHVSFFKLPAEVYHMPRIDIYLAWTDYLMIFSMALVWILLITYYLLRKLKNKSLLEGLRQEFV